MDNNATEITEFEQIARNIRKRSINARLSAWMSLLLIVVLGVIILNFYSETGTYTWVDSIGYSFSVRGGEERARMQSEIDSLKKELTDTKKTKDYLEAEIQKAQLDVEKLKLTNEASRSKETLHAITSSITRIGSVLVSLYIIQILLSVMRYSFRVADHLACSSDATVIGMGKAKLIREYLETISTNHIDFGKPPKTPSNDIGEIVDKVISKLPQNLSMGKGSG